MGPRNSYDNNIKGHWSQIAVTSIIVMQNYQTYQHVTDAVGKMVPTDLTDQGCHKPSIRKKTLKGSKCRKTEVCCSQLLTEVSKPCLRQVSAVVPVSWGENYNSENFINAQVPRAENTAEPGWAQATLPCTPALINLCSVGPHRPRV